MIRGKFKKKRRAIEDHFELQITSLADILVVVLVFLLKTFSMSMDNGIQNVVVPSQVMLPTAGQSGASDDGVRVVISSSEVKVSDGQSLQLQNYRFFPWDLVEGAIGTVKTSKMLNAAFEKERQTLKTSNGILWIMADKRAPYATIQTVLGSAALNGFTNIRLAVAKEE